jgi:ABC-type transporter lipoprotein component MlaA
VRHLLLGILLVGLTAGTAWGQSLTAQNVAGQIAQILAQSSASGARSSAISRDLRDQQGGQRAIRKVDEVAKLTVVSVVVGAIAADAANTGEIVNAAINAAPVLREDIITAAVRSYPAFAPTIYAAVGGAPNVLAGPPPTPAATTFIGAPQPARSPQRQNDDLQLGPAPDVATINDPLETINRGIFAFNDVLDRFLIRPIALGYGTITPAPVKRSVRNFFSNLRAPIRFANDVLQIDSPAAVTTGGRFLINSTVGVLGFFDVADRFGLAHQPADFGQTLHRYSVGSGPYIVIPLLGPSTARDGFGLAVDTFLDPLTYLMDTYPRVAVAATEAIIRRETLIEPLDELRAGSVDYYAALRAAYFQDRAVVLGKGRGAEKSAADDAFGTFE